MVIEADPRRRRAGARPRSARCPAHQSLRHSGPQRHALRPGRRRQRAAGDCRSAGAQQRLSPPPCRREPLERRRTRHQARPRADAGEIRHFLHLDDLQPGRRTAAGLHRRHGAAESRRHRDGAGPVSPRWRKSSPPSWVCRCRRFASPPPTRARSPIPPPLPPPRAPISTARRRKRRRPTIRQRLADLACDSAWRRARGRALCGRPRARGRTARPVCRTGARRPRGARVALGHGLLSHAEDTLEQTDPGGPALLLFCVRRRGQPKWRWIR